MTSSKAGKRDTHRASNFHRTLLSLALACCFTFCFLALPQLFAQTGGEGGIQGSVLDSTGAAIPKATVTATNTATGVKTTRTASSDGLYTISPIIPGVYTVEATATGFSGFIQKNLAVDALKLTGLNVTLTIGTATQEVTVTDAPPALETTNATLGTVMENKTYSNLPLQMSGQQRDPTAFATLAPRYFDRFQGSGHRWHRQLSCRCLYRRYPGYDYQPAR